ncbi:G-protein_alpha subunit [Hexamita inflata]|uniref:G-protein alpha subunit n=1 Tax=Hexamita inflata TaxID=28002 RepID=A0AA86P948_9EUKA|nr:G-protein alpha subunit [Hexamita inflata]
MNEKVLTSQALDKKLEQINHDQKRTTRVLVVGAQNSGKQTLMKQLRVFYDGSLLDFDLLKLRNKQDITQNMRSLVALMLNKGYLLPTDLVQQLFTDQSTCPKHILLQLSADPQIKLFMEQNSIPQNAKHSIINASRLLMMEQHDPFDLNDYLNSNIPLYTVKFNLNKNNYVFINNGSNLSYKWAELFRDVSGIVFVLDICTCFQRDSDGKSQVLTQLQEFDQTINQEYFKNSPVILLLNKFDQIDGLIKKHQFADFFPTYRGGNNQDEICAYIKERFEGLNRQPLKRKVFSFATSLNQAQVVQKLIEVITMVLQKEELRKIGFK